MAKFRTKPVAVEAVIYRGQFNTEIALWLIGDHVQCYADHAILRNRKGETRAEIGDWIVRDATGELHACKPDFFAATYAAD